MVPGWAAAPPEQYFRLRSACAIDAHVNHCSMHIKVHCQPALHRPAATDAVTPATATATASAIALATATAAVANADE